MLASFILFFCCFQKLVRAFSWYCQSRYTRSPCSFYLYFHYTRLRPRQYFCRAYSQQKNIQIYSFMIQCSALMFCLILKAKKILCGILGRLKSLTLSTAWAKQKLNMQVSPLNVSMHTFFFSWISRYLAAGELIGASMRDVEKNDLLRSSN